MTGVLLTVWLAAIAGQTSDVSEDPSLPPDQKEAIERAIEADAKASAATAAAPAPTPTGSPLSQVTGILNPEIAFIADVALSYFDNPVSSIIGGHDPSQTGFNLQQLELNARQFVDPYFRFDATIVFHSEGVEVEEVYATTLALPGGFQVKAGQFLTAFGRHNGQHLHQWNFVNQPFAVTRVMGPEANRGLGVQLSYLTPLPWYVEVIGSVTNAMGEGTTRSFYGETDLGIHSLWDFQWTGALKQFFELSPAWSLAWGLSAAMGPNSTGVGNRTQLFGTDLYLKYKPVHGAGFQQISLQAECFFRRREIPDDVLRDVNGYAQVLWRFAQRWEMGARYEYGTPARSVQGAAGVDDLDPEWLLERQRASAQLAFWPTEFSRLRLQGDADVAGWQSQTAWAIHLAFEFTVGAHGAHAF